MKINTILTTKGELQYYRDWDNLEGGIVMMNALTIHRYREIKNQHPDADKCGIFFAFSNRQVGDGYKHLIELGHIKDGDQIVQGSAGSYGTEEGLQKFFKFYEDIDILIKEECDPQEVYFYEYNNHESMFDWDGDTEAIKIIIDIWGADVARKIKRYDVIQSIDNMIRKPLNIRGLHFFHNNKKKVPENLWFSNSDGKCHSLYNNTLHDIYTSDGNAYYNKELSGLNALYDGHKICEFY